METIVLDDTMFTWSDDVARVMELFDVMLVTEN